MSNYVMTFEQYGAYSRGEKSLKEIRRERKEFTTMEKIAGEILRDTRLTKMVVFVMAGVDVAVEVLADSSVMVTKIDNAGARFLGLGQTLGYWLCLIGCIIEILKSVMNGGNREVGKIIMKYILFFASLYLVPFAFDLIIEFFA